jgi:hypothetical protein
MHFSIPEGRAALRAAVSEMDRLLRGDFTAEEIHGFCHKLPETVSAEAFAGGCAAYQEKLYGRSPFIERTAALIAEVTKQAPLALAISILAAARVDR